MKYLILLSFFVGFQAQAEHSFVFVNQQGGLKRFEYQSYELAFEEAFKEAAKACYKHFKDGKRLTEDEGLKIIDICANPRNS